MTKEVFTKHIHNVFEHKSDAVKFKNTFTPGTHKVVKSKIFDMELWKNVPCYTVVRK